MKFKNIFDFLVLQFQIDAKDTGFSAPSFKDDDLFDFDVDTFYKMVANSPILACSRSPTRLD